MANPPEFFPEMFDSGFWQEPDFLLAHLVSLMANTMDSGLGVTLLVKGAILTGTLISERDYLDSINNVFRSIAKSALKNPSREELASIDETFTFDDMAEDDYPPEDEDDEDDDDEDDEDDEDLLPMGQIRHLHLEAPTLIYPGSSISFTDSMLPVMRIKLTAIDGWLLGRMTLMERDDGDFGLPPDNGIRH